MEKRLFGLIWPPSSHLDQSWQGQGAKLKHLREALPFFSLNSGLLCSATALHIIIVG